MNIVSDARREIDSLIERRAVRLREVDRQAERWRVVDARLVAVDQALTALRNHPDASAELRAVLTGGTLRDLRKRVGDLLEDYSRLGARFARQSVTVGVSGQARVGKSTLLQSLSGLGEGQIPTGSGWPVTAVRIRLDHSRGRQRVVVSLHSAGSFLTDVIDRLHRELGFPTAPATLDEFAAWPYPGEDEVSAIARPTLVRLLDLQAGLPTYRDDLVGGETEVPFGALRPYVAYPHRTDPHPVHKYAAVRDARIECQFPHDDLSRLSVVDLPGLGEIAPDADRRHVAGLRDEVDAVLMVKRAVEGMAYWTDPDKGTLALLSEAAGPIRRLGDFVYLVANAADGDSPALMDAMLDAINKTLNGRTDGRFFTVLRSDVGSSQDVGANVLAPLLAALAERLPAMDREMMDAADGKGNDLAQTVRAEITEFEQALHRLRGHFTAQAEDIKDQARLLRESISVGLHNLLRDLELSTQQAEDAEFLAATEDAYQRLLTWIGHGLGTGVGTSAPRPAAPADHGGEQAGEPDEEVEESAEDLAREAWIKQALPKMIADGGDGRLATDEFNRLRVEISRGFAAINVHFDSRLRGLRRDVARVIAARTGRVLDLPAARDGDIDGDTVLAGLAGLLIEGYEPSPTLRAAVTELLGARLEYQTQLYPRVRAQLSQMRLAPVSPTTGKPQTQITVEITESGAEELHDFLRMRAEQAAYDTLKELSAESILPSTVLYAILEQFDDALIRSGESATEFERFARSYQNELWPDRYEGLVSNHARVAGLTRACQDVLGALDS